MAAKKIGNKHKPDLGQLNNALEELDYAVRLMTTRANEYSKYAREHGEDISGCDKIKERLELTAQISLGAMLDVCRLYVADEVLENISNTKADTVEEYREQTKKYVQEMDKDPAVSVEIKKALNAGLKHLDQYISEDSGKPENTASKESTFEKSEHKSQRLAGGIGSFMGGVMGVLASFAIGAICAVVITQSFGIIPLVLGGVVGVMAYRSLLAPKSAEKKLESDNTPTSTSGVQDTVKVLQKSIDNLGAAVTQALDTKKSIESSMQANMLNTTPNRPNYN